MDRRQTERKRRGESPEARQVISLERSFTDPRLAIAITAVSSRAPPLGPDGCPRQKSNDGAKHPGESPSYMGRTERLSPRNTYLPVSVPLSRMLFWTRVILDLASCTWMVGWEITAQPFQGYGRALPTRREWCRSGARISHSPDEPRQLPVAREDGVGRRPG